MTSALSRLSRLQRSRSHHAGWPWLDLVWVRMLAAQVCHMMSAFPTATFKCHNDTETYLYDVVTDTSREAMEPVNGFVRCAQLAQSA